MTSSITTPQRIEGLRATTADDYLARMTDVQNYIRDHLDDEELAPEQLARTAAMSLHHFHRIFRGMFGESVAEHLRRLRLERGALQLRRTERTILEVAVDAGYGSHEAFTRAFKALFARTPSEFRALPSLRVESLKPAISEELVAVELRKFKATPLLGLRHWGEYQELSGIFTRLGGHALTSGLSPESIEMCGIYYDDPEITPPERLRSDACLVNREGLNAEGEFFTTTISEGTYAIALHRGPYESLLTTYLQLIGHWLPRSGYGATSDPVVERYLNSPHDTEPEDLLTEVCIRLQPS